MHGNTEIKTVRPARVSANPTLNNSLPDLVLHIVLIKGQKNKMISDRPVGNLTDLNY